MATFDLSGGHPGITKLTSDVSGAHDIINNFGSILVAGVLVRVSKGRSDIVHLDADTLQTVMPGETVTVDPTTVTGAIGIGVTSPEKQANSTSDKIYITQVSAPLKSESKTGKAKTK
jgi:hypothetical protein